MHKTVQSGLALMLSVAVLAFCTPLAAGEWTDTEVFVDVEDTRALIQQGAAVVDAREAHHYRSGHIAGAAHLHWQQFVHGDASGELIDDDEQIADELTDAGVTDDEPVVVYGAWDNEGWGEEGRIFWMLEYLGHDEVYLLEGGISAWKRAGQPVATNSDIAETDGEFTVDRRPELRTTTDELRRQLERNGSEIAVLDARERAEYEGVVRYGESRGGHIPGAEHLWWEELIDENGSLLDRDRVEAKLEQRGVDGDGPVVAYCTGGVRSGFVYAVLRAAGVDQAQNYDASMWEWTADDDAPVQ